MLSLSAGLSGPVILLVVLLCLFNLVTTQDIGCPGKHDVLHWNVSSLTSGTLAIDHTTGRYCAAFGETVVIQHLTNTSNGVNCDTTTAWPLFYVQANIPANGSVIMQCSWDVLGVSHSSNVPCLIEGNISLAVDRCWQGLWTNLLNASCSSNVSDFVNQTVCVSSLCNFTLLLELPYSSGDHFPTISISSATQNVSDSPLDDRNYNFKMVSRSDECMEKCMTNIVIGVLPEMFSMNTTTEMNISVDFDRRFIIPRDEAIINVSLHENHSLSIRNWTCLVGNIEMYRIDQSVLSLNVTAVAANNTLACTIWADISTCSRQFKDMVKFTASVKITPQSRSLDICTSKSTIAKAIHPINVNMSVEGHLNLTADHLFSLDVELFLHHCGMHLQPRITLPSSQGSIIPLVYWDTLHDVNGTITSDFLGSPLSVVITEKANELWLDFGIIDPSNVVTKIGGRLSFKLQFKVEDQADLIFGRGGAFSFHVLNTSTTLPILITNPTVHPLLQVMKQIESVDYSGKKPSLIFVVVVAHKSSSTGSAANVNVTDFAADVAVSTVWSSPPTVVRIVNSITGSNVTVMSSSALLPVGENFTLRYRALFIPGVKVPSQFSAAAVTWQSLQDTSHVMGPAMSDSVCIEAQTRYTVKVQPAYGFIALGVFSGLFAGTLTTMIALYLFRKTSLLRRFRVDFESSQHPIDAEGRDTTFHLSDGYGMDSSRENDSINHVILSKDSYCYWTCYAVSPSPVDADLLITRDMIRDLSEFQKRCANISLLCWKSSLRGLISALCRSGEISADAEYKMSSNIDKVLSQIVVEAADDLNENWCTVADVVQTCSSIMRRHSLISLSMKREGIKLLNELVTLSHMDGMAKKSLLDSFTASLEYIMSATDTYMEDAYKECQHMAWRRRNMALLLSFTYNRYFLLIDWLVKKFHMELDGLQRKRLLSIELAQRFCGSIKDTAAQASMRFHLASRAFAVSNAEKTAAQYAKQIRILETRWEVAHTALGEKFVTQSKSGQQTEIDAMVNKQILCCKEIEKEIMKSKYAYDDKTYLALKNHLIDSRSSTIDWFTSAMMKAATKADGKVLAAPQPPLPVGLEASEVTLDAMEAVESEFDRTSICDVINAASRKVAQYDIVTNDELQVTQGFIQEQLNQELKVLDNSGNNRLLKEIRRKAKVIIRSVLSSCPCSGKSYIYNILEKWNLSVTNRVLGRFLFKALIEFEKFECKLHPTKHTDIFLSVLPSHDLEKLLEVQKHDLQYLISSFIATVDKVFVKDPENADCIFKADLMNMLIELIAIQSDALRKILQWHSEVTVMRNFFDAVSRSDLSLQQPGVDEDDALRRCLEGYAKDVKILLALDLDVSHDLPKQDKNELASILSSFLDHVNSVTRHSQTADYDLDFILLDENETLRAMMSLAADSAHLDTAMASIIAIESKSVECFSTLYKMNVLPRPLFNDTLDELTCTVSEDRMKEISLILFGKAKPVDFSQEITRRAFQNKLESRTSQENNDGVRRRVATRGLSHTAGNAVTT